MTWESHSVLGLGEGDPIWDTCPSPPPLLPLDIWDPWWLPGAGSPHPLPMNSLARVKEKGLQVLFLAGAPPEQKSDLMGSPFSFWTLGCTPLVPLPADLKRNRSS